MTERRKWSRQELLAAFYIYATEAFGRLHQRNPVIVSVANKIDRTPSALAMKACNFASLDPAHKERGIKGLGNVSQADRELWQAFLDDSLGIVNEAEEIVRPWLPGGQKDEPEFLGMTESVRETTVRRAQGFFRKAVVAGYSGQCALSGIKIPELLVASHIIPWSKSAEHRVDPRNGVLLNALYDRAFDRGLFTFDDNFKVVISSALPADTPLMNISGLSMALPERWRPTQDIMRFHRENIFVR